MSGGTGGAGPGEVLFEFVRYWSRRVPADDPRVAERGRWVLVTEAVAAVTRDGPATINAVAQEIGMDQSGASRLVKGAVAAGYLRMQAAQADGRRRHVTLTPAGRELLERAHGWQEAVFDRLTAGWDEPRRVAFHAAMLDLLDRGRALRAYR
ncbi:MAG: MarR family winged helix-turn-helix transcriptional regulator [Pseudonocardia sp.]